MNQEQEYLLQLLAAHHQPPPENRMALLEQFCMEAGNSNVLQQLQQLQQTIIADWNMKNRILDILEQPFTIPNATVDKPYEAVIPFEQLRWEDMVLAVFEGLESTGLVYDAAARTISGTPVQSGDYKLIFRFRLAGEAEDSLLHERVVPLIINPNPRSLWKNLESDRNDKGWKEDNVSELATLGSRYLVVASKRGRSHANTGGFRDDDYAWRYFETTGWSVIAVADGAGSAPQARQGSRIAVQAVVDYFTTALQAEGFPELDSLLQERAAGAGEDNQKRLNHFVYNNLGKAALYVHKQLDAFAAGNELALKDLHTTLHFVLLKQYPFGYAVLWFSVGDGPVGLITPEGSQAPLLNWLDVGEYGGGTRFITMPEVFKSDKFHTRFGCRLVKDFSYLFLMTDGIFDPKFATEANLEKAEKWQELIADLHGANDDNCQVHFTPDNQEVAGELSAWMDFWSSGNHDDRTLAIVF